MTLAGSFHLSLAWSCHCPLLPPFLWHTCWASWSWRKSCWCFPLEEFPGLCKTAHAGGNLYSGVALILILNSVHKTYYKGGKHQLIPTYISLLHLIIAKKAKKLITIIVYCSHRGAIHIPLTHSSFVKNISLNVRCCLLSPPVLELIIIGAKSVKRLVSGKRGTF